MSWKWPIHFPNIFSVSMQAPKLAWRSLIVLNRAGGEGFLQAVAQQQVGVGRCCQQRVEGVAQHGQVGLNLIALEPARHQSGLLEPSRPAGLRRAAPTTTHPGVAAKCFAAAYPTRPETPRTSTLPAVMTPGTLRPAQGGIGSGGPVRCLAMTSRSVGRDVLESVRAAGVDRVYAIAGTDFAPLIEAWAQHGEQGAGDGPGGGSGGDGPGGVPEPVLVAHEAVAVGMAHGAWLATGRPQAAMVHVSVGTANALCALMNAARDRVPLLFAAGRTPISEAGRHGSRDVHIHWGQELFDQAAMLRELVKWDFELRAELPAAAVVSRAVSLAMTEPKGPVYLSLPREVLATTDTHRPSGAAASMPASPPHPDPAALACLADRVAAARFPVVVAGAAGHDQRIVAALGELCDTAAVGLVERTTRAVHLPDSHSAHLGHRPDAVLGEADVVIVLDSDVPWFPGLTRPRDDAFVAQIGVDPLFTTYPLRTHRADLSLCSTPTAAVVALTGEVRSRLDPALAAARRDTVASRAAELRGQVEAEAAADEASHGPITKVALSRALGQVLPPEAVVVNEYPILREHLPRSLPGTWFNHPPSGGLGWGLPAALGVQQARPDHTVVAAVGDGAYLFANPAACHHAAAAHGLPVLTVVCNNRRWDAVRLSTVGMYPEGMAVTAPQMDLVSLEPAPDYVRYAEASGGWGARVEQRRDLVPTLRQALSIVTTERRQALVDVSCA